MSQSRSRAAVVTFLRIVGDVARFASAVARPHARLAAENLFLRKQLALCVERKLSARVKEAIADANPKFRKKKPRTRVLALPDLEHAKTAESRGKSSNTSRPKEES
jgi:hypothetical protein